MKNLLYIALSLIFTAGFAQNASVNDYQYVIVPLKYDFQKSDNQYRLNTLTKFLLEKEGFKVFFEGEQPDALRNSPCEVLKADVVNQSNVFTTKLIFQLKDCYGTVVVETEEGKSKIKEYEPSYHEAFRNTFEGITALEYAYVPGKKAVAGKEVAGEKEIEVPDTAQNQEEATEAVAIAATSEVVSQPSDLKDLPVLYAQAIDNGYQLVDTTPAVRFKVRKTSRENTYTIIGEDGLLYRQEDGSWMAEYYKDGKLVKEVFTIKF